MVTSLSRSSSVRERTLDAPYFRWGIALLFLAGLVGGFLALRGKHITPLSIRLPAANPVVAAWQAALARGAYSFASDVVQTTMPVAGVANVGKSSREERLHLEGDNDLRAQTMNLRLWSQKGNLTDQASGLEVRVADDKTLIRQQGGEWQERSDFTGALAPNGDLMSYLAGLHTVQLIAVEEKAGFSYSRYRFDLDGPSIAAYLRDQLQARLTQRGELPPGLTLQAPEQFALMTGVGELWVRSDAAGRGLPLRQILDLRFPEVRGAIVTARIDTTFRDFAPAPRGWLPSIGSVQDFSVAALTIGLAGLLALIVIRRRRSHFFYTGLVSVIILAQVVGPLLQNARLVAFIDLQSARAAGTEQEQSEAAMVETLRQQVKQPRINPNADPLAVADPPAASTLDQQPGLAFQSQGAPVQTALRQNDPGASLALAADDGADRDNDGLTDFVEERIGTDVEVADTDTDNVNDGQEVLGFTHRGQQWYGDPLQPDSNRDGQIDALEWRLDTDNDGIPDLHDDDNDGDGVVDAQDLAPFVQVHPNNDANAYFTSDQPLQLTLNDLTVGRLTAVDFQLRPRDPKHLWYALNVLDWPQDRAGPIQDSDNTTFADVNTTSAGADASEANGDLRLLPMLEIRFPSAAANLPAAADLQPYNIAVTNLTPDRSQQAAYVPLNLVTDAESGERQAFQGRMIYQPTGAWATPHAVRLVWVVQALVDLCRASADGVCTDYELLNQPQAIHVYPDDFVVTGLTVREEHGTQLAIIYEDPGADTPAAFERDDAIWQLTYGLDNSFLAARDDNNDGQRDLTLAEVERRFNRTTNGAISELERWEIANVLRVERRTYATLDQAVAATIMTETVRILNTVYTPVWSPANPINPLLLFGREEVYRTQGLDGLHQNSGYITAQGSQLTVDMQPGGPATNTPLNTVVSLKAASYCTTGSGAVAWSACDRAQEWERLGQRYAPALTTHAGGDLDLAAAQLTLLRFYYLALAEGVHFVVQEGAQILTPTQGFQSDSAIGGTVRTLGGVGGSLTALIASVLTNASALRSESVIQELAPFSSLDFVSGNAADAGRDLGITGLALESIRRLWAEASTGSRIIGVLVAILIGVLIITAVALVAHFAPAVGQAVVSFATRFAPVLVALLQLFVLVNRLVAVVQLVSRLTAAHGSAGAVSRVLSGSSSLAGTSRTSAIVGATIGVLVVWGVFLANVILSRTTPFSPQFNALFAQAIAQTILIVLMAAISATVIGLIIIGIIALIDAILTAICELGVAALRTVPGLNGACFTLGTTATVVVAKLLYSFDTMVNTDRGELVISGAPDVNLAAPARGFVADNPVAVTLPVTTTVVHKDPAPQNWLHILPYIGFFSPDNLTSSTFRYSLTADQATVNVDRYQMQDQWRNVAVDHHFAASPMYRAQARQDVVSEQRTLPAGINRVAPYHFNLGYAIPAYECWAIPNTIPVFIPPYFPVCYVRTLAGGNSQPLNQIVLDILPTTLDEFLTLVDDGSGAFKQGWDPAFTALADADGDGLRVAARGGMDPDDATWDADGDGVGDRAELEWRVRGIATSPTTWDSDGDGLSDAQELQIGSHPALADTDNDGLRDGEEVRHLVARFDSVRGQVQISDQWAGGWTVVLTGTQPLNLLVSSNPLAPDSDGDGLFDQAERELAQSNATDCGLNRNQSCRLDVDGRPYHPRIINRNPLAVYPAINDADRLVAPGQRLLYSTTVENLGVPVVAGGLEVSAPPTLGAPLSTYRLDLDVANIVTHTTSFVVAADSASGDLTISSRARARLIGPNIAPWSWDAATPNTQGTLGGGAQSIFVNAEAARPDRQDSYLLTALTRDANPLPLQAYDQVLWRGDTRVLGIPGGVNRTVDEDNTNLDRLRSHSAPQVACNDAERCLVVWDSYDVCNTVTFTTVNINRNNEEANGLDFAFYFRTQREHTLPALPLYRLLGSRVDQPNNTNIALNFVQRFCGTGVLEVWEFDIPNNTLPPSPAPGPGMFKVDQFEISHSFVGNRTTRIRTTPDGPIEANVSYRAPDKQFQPILGAILNTAGDVVTPQFPIANQPLTFAFFPSMDFRPTVASDGSNFLVVWERVRTLFPGMETGLVHHAFNSFGDPINNEVVLGTIGVNDTQDYRPYTNIDALWIGDRYRLAWKHDDGVLRSMDLNAGGGIVRGPVNEAANALDLNQAPRLAYDPHSGRVLLAYLDNTNNLRGIFYADSQTNGVNQRVTNGGGLTGVQAAYHPLAAGWLAAWTATTNNRLAYQLLNLDGSPRADLALQTTPWPNPGNNFVGATLACPAGASVPVHQLPFDELPGVTRFVDTSARGAAGDGAAATCNGADCPLAGVTGAPRAPLSDYGVQFNGIDQKLALTLDSPRDFTFSLAFWIKTSQSSGDPSTWRNGMGILTGPGIGVSLGGGRILFGNDNRTLQSAPINDDRWHFVVATASFQNYALYVDGALAANTSMAPSSIVTPNGVWRIGSQSNDTNFFAGALDHLTIYDSVLAADTVRQLNLGPLPSYCLAALPAVTAVAGTVQLNLRQNDTRGGVINASSTLSLTVDATPPTSTITSLTNGATIQGNPGGELTQIIGGTASDRNGVALVEISVNGGAWQATTGGATWSFPLSVTRGRHTLQSRATDRVGNVESNPATTVIVVDDRAPTVSVDLPANAILHPRRPPFANDHTLTVRGAVNDPDLGDNAPGAGIASVELLFQDQVTGMTGNFWQGALIENGRWTVEYHFVAGLPTAPRVNGPFTLTLRAVDKVGNVSEQQLPVQLDSEGPNVALSGMDITRSVITDTLCISGVISDATGVAGLDVAFTPIQRVRALSDTLVFLAFDEPVGAQSFQDSSASRRVVSCINGCTAGEAGRHDGAVRIAVATNVEPIEIYNYGEFDFGAEQSFSFQSWLRTSQTDGRILTKEDFSNVGFGLHLQGGRAALWLNGGTVATSAAPVNDDQWHHLVGVVDRATGQAQLYVDGALAGSGAFDGALFTALNPLINITIGGRFGETGATDSLSGWFDDVAIFDVALTPTLVDFLYRAAGTGWLPATLTRPNTPQSEWTLDGPTDLEGQYQIDLRGADTAGHRDNIGYPWRGIIDTLAPRLQVEATFTGDTMIDPQDGAPRYAIAYRYRAEDRHLAETTLRGPCQGVSPLQRGFAADAEMGGLFPDLTLLTSLQTSCQVWERSQTPVATVRACDIYGHCTTATPSVTASATVAGGSANAADSAALPTAMITNPTAGAIVAASPDFSVTVAAHADQLLREVVILLDDSPVQTLVFAQEAAIRAAQRTVAIGAPEGVFTLSVRATDWAGNVQSTLTPISITVDTQAPVVTLDQDQLTLADAWSTTSSMVRLHGAASDSIGLAAVQLRLNDGAFQPAFIDAAGQWRAAVWLGEMPEGKHYQIIVRASDRAGRSTEISKELLADMPVPAVRLETTLTDQPANPTASTTASFSFTGVDQAGAPLTNFLCRLDGGAFTPCTSPVTYSNLAQGVHHFSVLASNGNGQIDGTPASYTWRVGVAEPPVTPAQRLFLPLVMR